MHYSSVLAGYGGGFMERDEVVEYIERNDSDDEFDEVIGCCLNFLEQQCTACTAAFYSQMHRNL